MLTAVRHHGLLTDGWTHGSQLPGTGNVHPCRYIYQNPHPLVSIHTALHLPRLKVTVYPTEKASLPPNMTDTHTTPYEKDYTSPAVPVIQVNGENIEVNETTERYVSCVGSTNLQGTHGTYMTLSLRNKHSPLCNQVVTACDSGRTLEESLRAHREHQQAKINELQVSHSGLDFVSRRNSELLSRNSWKIAR
jgi:hypothetical protein